jgi:hypothetical protein
MNRGIKHSVDAFALHASFTSNAFNAMKKLSTVGLLFSSLFVSALLFSSCGSSTSEPQPDDTKGTVTAVGTPSGTPTSASIDASGGTVISSDGRLELVIPPDALSSSTVITIQPITNEASLGAGLGFSLSPNGQQFTQPVTLLFHYNANDLQGTDVKALRVAVQKADHIWYVLDNPVLDASAGTLSVSTTHFSDYGIVDLLWLDPAYATIAVKQTKQLNLEMLKKAEDSDPSDNVTPLRYVPYPIVDEVSWSVNGNDGGNPNDGTVAPASNSATTTYTAPASITGMSSNPVAVTATLFHPAIPEKILMSSNITVTGGAGVGGRITLTLSLNDSRTHSNGGMVEVKKEVGTAELVYALPNIPMENNGFSRDANWDDAAFNGASSQTSEHLRTYDLICNGGAHKTITDRDKNVTIYEGGRQVTGAGLTIADDGTYTIMLGPPSSLDAAANTYTTWTNSCELPERVESTPSRAPVPFAPYFIPYIGGGAMKTTGKIDPAHPNSLKGVYHGTDQLTMFSFGTETITMPVEYTITWDLTLVP